jgi:hypothetical protein
MKQISLRLPDDVHAALKELAQREQRSLHGQIVHILRRHAIPLPPEDGSPLAQS